MTKYDFVVDFAISNCHQGRKGPFLWIRSWKPHKRPLKVLKLFADAAFHGDTRSGIAAVKFPVAMAVQDAFKFVLVHSSSISKDSPKRFVHNH